ncbi:MAG TPA: hypothetical protein VGI81_26660 [Tepidisphaeraceae bacterium]
MPRRTTDAKLNRRAALAAIACALGGGGLAAAFRYLGRERAVPGIPAPARPIVATTQPVTRPAVEPVEKVYREAIVPLLDQFDRRNDEAVINAIVVLHDRMAMHRAGVGQFTKEVVSWGTRFGVIKRYPGDAWHKLRGESGDARRVAEYVNEKFRRHIISEDSLRQDVEAVVAQFNDDMLASRNRLYADLALPLARIKVSHPITTPGLEDFSRDVATRASRMAGAMAPDTVVAGLAAVCGSWTAMDVAQGITSRVVMQILARLGTAMAAEGIEAGGATLGGAAAGGGGGSLAGPVGTVIGIGVGLVVGAIVDWRMSKQFEAKVTDQCNWFLINLERQLRDGTPYSPGLKDELGEAAALASRLQREAIQSALKEVKE